MTPDEQRANQQADNDEGIKKLRGKMYNCTAVDPRDYVPAVKTDQVKGNER